MIAYSDEIKKRAVFYQVQVATGKISASDFSIYMARDFPASKIPTYRSAAVWASQGVEPDNELETAEQIVEQFDSERESRELKNTIRQKDRQIKILEKRTDFITQCTDAIKTTYNPLPAIVVPDRPTSRGVRESVSFFWNDIHFNMRVDPDKMESVPGSTLEKPNAYNLEISNRRMSAYTDIIIDQIQKHATAKNIDTVYLVCLGDLNNGDIHNGEGYNCEHSSMLAAKWLGEILSEQFVRIRKSCPWVELDIVFVNGNHGRILVETQKKANNPVTVASNYDWITGTIVQQIMNGQPRTTVDVPLNLWSYRDIYGKLHAYYHGDSIRGGMTIGGYPLYGVARKRYEKGAQMQQTHGREPDCYHHGHIHRYGVLEIGGMTVCYGNAMIGNSERGELFGWNAAISQRCMWHTEKHPIGAAYQLNIPPCLD